MNPSRVIYEDAPTLISASDELHHHKIEVIFWPLDMETKLLTPDPTTNQRRRSPPASLAGKVRELGDVMNSAPASDWGIDP